MMEELEQQPIEEQEQENKFLAFLSSVYQKVNVFSKIEEEDSILLMIGKIIIRIIGFIFILALSPFLILGLIIAFAAAF